MIHSYHGRTLAAAPIGTIFHSQLSSEPNQCLCVPGLLRKIINTKSNYNLHRQSLIKSAANSPIILNCNESPILCCLRSVTIILALVRRLDNAVAVDQCVLTSHGVGGVL